MHVISIVGKHNIGKTYLLEQMIPKLIKKYQIAVIKHTIHEIKKDEKGTDTYRLSKAGSNLTAIISDHELSLSLKEKKVDLNQIIAVFEKLNPNIDILFLEGYKKEPYPKIIIIDDLDYINQFIDEEIILIVSKNIELLKGDILNFNDIDMILTRIEKYIKKSK